MAPLSQWSGYINSTCGAENSTGANRARPYAYYALSYCALILAIIFGNGLVCVAVLRERALQTTTNYLVVSLAVADLLVATLVMPWVVYLEVTGGIWNFSRICCDVFVTLDVMMCTASILNLCAISIDRYTAVVMPVHYQHGTGQGSCRRVALMITAVWVLAFTVSCPLLFGFNTTGDPSICSISNPDFVIYSSVVSFYVPFGVTVLVYARIYMVLRQRRRKRILTRQNSQCISIRPDFPQQSSCLRLHPIRQFSVRTRFPSDATGRMPRGVPLREKKATQMVAIVLGAFIVCWMPFFLTHVLNTHCQACHVSPELYRATTWLGYVNSALNPVIYTTFNVEFRKAFLKILSC
ncbi:D(3) dopamine receptor isoform X3 [Heterocephalus glaber]|uniref:D(3) dopamine receptor n=1 Tax=Heterocephalus glaber TaxID=10181 RepID=A0AAX6TDK6_HETGA|nr:D(3) dopamine receptor isoform X3 [Heterocephalus glaber]